jgi:hypothetical protein
VSRDVHDDAEPIEMKALQAIIAPTLMRLLTAA